jgi:light-regulated signal transduction histidine kinase (bacteriophytochrome)
MNYTNERSTLPPEGHIPIERHISLPILQRGEVIGLIQVANKERDYTEDDLGLLKTLGDSIAPVLDARLTTNRQERFRNQAEEQLKQSNDNLARSNEELEQFAYVASHDLQEPLRMVASYVQLLERRYKDKLDQDAIDFIHYAVDGATRMKTLINDLLMYSRVGTRGKSFEKINLSSVVKETIGTLKHLIDENMANVTCGDLPEVWADKGQMGQLFQNLIQNAIKYRGDAAPDIQISAVEENDEWRFSVTDNGQGIDPQFFDRIFIIFQQLQSKGADTGNGIGLAVCKKIVERHKGRIWLASELGKGTTFYFTLPREINS